MSAGPRLRTALRSAGFTASLAAQRGLPFLALPIVARSLSQADYGISALCVSIASIAGVVINLGIGSSIPRMVHKPREYGDGAWVTILLLQCSLAVAVLLLCLGAALIVGRESPEVGVLVLATAAMACTASVQQAFQGLSVAQGRAGRLLAATLAQMGVGLGLIPWLVQSIGPAGYLASLAVASACAIAVLAPGRYPERSHSRSSIRAAIRVSWPFIGQGASTWLISLSDRIIIGALVGANLLGEYQTAYMIGSSLGVVLEGLQASWSPRYYRSEDPAKATRLLTLVPCCLKFAAPLVVALVGLTPWIMSVVAPSYAVNLAVTALVAACALPRAAYFVAVVALLDVGKSVAIMSSTMIGGVLAALLALLLVPIVGIPGGGIATLTAFTIQSAFVSQMAFARGKAGVAKDVGLFLGLGAALSLATAWLAHVSPLWSAAIGVGALLLSLAPLRRLFSQIHWVIGPEPGAPGESVAVP